jgi:hypothetical protein
VLTAAGARLHLDGRPTFLVLASYFDAMRASPSVVERDFAFLKSRGVGGVRIFPLWIRHGQDPAATLFDERGEIRSPARWAHFVSVLNAAASCGMVVDATFNRDMLTNVVAPVPVERYGAGIAEVARRLKAEGGHPHVFIDLQNERNRGIPGMDFTIEEVRALRDAVKAADPHRLVMCSTVGGVEGTLNLVSAAGLDVTAFHEGQTEGWYEETPATVAALRRGPAPVYLQEMGRAPDRGAICDVLSWKRNAFADALGAAVKAGAAAWTFHTAAGFRLDAEPFQDRLRHCAREMEFLDGLRASLDRLL